MKTEEYSAMANLLYLAEIAIKQSVLRPQGVVPDEYYEFDKERSRLVSGRIIDGDEVDISAFIKPAPCEGQRQLDLGDE